MKCGIDPGRYKIGLAFAEGEELLFSAIIPKTEQSKIAGALRDGAWSPLSKWRQEGDIALLEDKKPEKIYLGGGTSSDEIQKLFEDAGIGVEVTDEYGTTLEGRKRYWRLHPPRGLWRIIPVSLRTPPRNIDDLAAWAIIKER